MEDIPFQPRDAAREAAHRIVETPEDENPDCGCDDVEPNFAPFTKGATVRLKSGGPSMTVEDLLFVGDHWEVMCRWFSCRHENQSDTFDGAVLEAADPDDERLFGYDSEVHF